MTSGLRLGTPAVTTRGLNEDDMDLIADCIFMAMSDDFENNVAEIQGKVNSICDRYPLYK